MDLFYPIKKQRVKYLLIDLMLLALSVLFALVITSLTVDNERFILNSCHVFGIIPLTYIIPLYIFQVYRINWEFSIINDFYLLFTAQFIGYVLSSCIGILRPTQHPHILYLLTFFFSTFMLIYYRALIRELAHRKKLRSRLTDIPYVSKSRKDKKIIIIGAGEAGRIILAELNKTGLGRNVQGFVDDDKLKIGTLFNGKKVFSSVNEANDIIRRFDIDEVIIAMPSVRITRVNSIAAMIKSHYPNLQIKILPNIMKTFETTLTPELRDIDISELIERDEADIDISLIESYFYEKTVLVTGAGGSIGSEICRQLLRFNIKKLIALGRGEHSIYTLMNTLRDVAAFVDRKPEIVYRIVDVKDYNLLAQVFKEYKPDIVFHAAAHKHVPLMEYNEIEAFQNNVLGTRNTIDLSTDNAVGDFVLISTDKAVRPVNVMGATKRLAELITAYYHRERGLKTSIVRFGNVIGSRGSVIPLFKEQIEKGGPVTVTHPDIKRYFMSIPEASLLVINAVAFAEGGEIFALDMGEQYKIIDIARNLIKLYGLIPERDIPIAITGLRAGEKLYEELFYDAEKLQKTDNEKIFVLKNDGTDYHKEALEAIISDKDFNIINYNPASLRKLLKEIIADYDFNNQG